MFAGFLDLGYMFLSPHQGVKNEAKVVSKFVYFGPLISLFWYFGKMVACFKKKNLLDHIVISTFVKSAFFWIKFDYEIFATLCQENIFNYF